MIKILLIIMSIIIFIACSNESVEKNDIKDAIAISKENKISNSQELAEIPFMLQGEIRAWLNDSNELVMYAETASDKHIFVLQHIDKAQLANLNKSVFSELVYLDDIIRLQQANGEEFVLGVEGREAALSLINSRYPNINKDHIYSGKGLVHIECPKSDTTLDFVNIIYLQSLASVAFADDASTALRESAGM